MSMSVIAMALPMHLLGGRWFVPTLGARTLPDKGVRLVHSYRWPASTCRVAVADRYDRLTAIGHGVALPDGAGLSLGDGYGVGEAIGGRVWSGLFPTG